MKKSLVVVVSFLLVASFVSAFSFSDIFGKITGEAILNADEVIFSDNSRPISVSIEVDEGWNLIQVLPILNGELIESGGNVDFNNVRGAYQLLPFSKDYVQIMNESQDDLIDSTVAQGEMMANKFIRGGTEAVKLKFDSLLGLSKEKNPQNVIDNVAWVYFDKSGILKYTDPQLELSTNMLMYIQLIKGYNFVAVIPIIFGSNEVFTLNEIKGNCDISQAHFFDTKSDNWITIDLDQKIDKSYLGRGMSIEVSDDCIFGKIVGNDVCVDDDRGDNPIKRGEVKIIDGSGQVIQSESDECTFTGFKERYCGFTDNGDIFIGSVVRQDCLNCVNGACLDNVPESITCFDIEGTIGIGSGISAGYTLLKKDLSFVQDSCYIKEAEVDYCLGKDCVVKEYFCNGDVREFKFVSCLGNCSKGVCYE